MRLAKIWIKNVFRIRRSAPEAMKKSKNKKRVYYSHPMVLYGTSIEKNALKLVRSKFDNVKIINPSDFPDCEMNDYCDIVKKCHILVAHPLSKNVFSAGVVKEIKTALKHKIPAFCLDIVNERIFEIHSLKGFKCLSREDTRTAFHDYYFEQASKSVRILTYAHPKLGRLLPKTLL